MTKKTQAVKQLLEQYPALSTVLGQAQLDTIAENMDTILTVIEPDVKATVKDILKRLHDMGNGGDKEFLKQLVIDINMQRIHTQQAEHIKKYGFSVQGVFPQHNGDPSFCYTIGLSVKTGYEFIAVSTSSIDNMHLALNAYSQVALNGGDITKENTDIFFTVIDGVETSLRTKAVKVNAAEARKEHITTVMSNKPFDVYQIYIADEHNLMPDEEGYDAEFKQPLFDLA